MHYLEKNDPRNKLPAPNSFKIKNLTFRGDDFGYYDTKTRRCLRTIQSIIFYNIEGVFAEKGARFRGKWGSAPSAPLPPPQKFPWAPTPSPLLEEPPPPLGFSVKPPPPPRRRGGGMSGRGWGLGLRPHLPRKRAPFSAKTPYWAKPKPCPFKPHPCKDLPKTKSRCDFSSAALHCCSN